MSERYITIELMGGIGNLLFQIAALFHYAERYRRVPFFYQETTPLTVHSQENYWTTVFANFQKYIRTELDFVRVEEGDGCEELLASERPSVCLVGYFQNWKLAVSLPPLLVFDETVLSRYPDISSCVFLHIRGGDYRGSGHEVSLARYYKESLGEFPRDVNYVVFTNDVDYANQFLPLLKNYQLVQEDTLSSLLLMSRCRGGICANSTFSWWGGFLNAGRHIVIPRRWHQNVDFVKSEGYEAPNWVVLDN